MATLHFNILRKAARWYGWELLKKKKSDSIDLHLQRFFSCNSVDLVVDCGANRGQFGKLCRATGYRGKILSFEPVADAFAALSRAASSDGNWEARQYALGNVREECSINVAAGDATLSSLYSVVREKEAEIGFCKTELVSVRRLDEVLEHEGVPLSTPIFLKSDTQGNDLNVLRGAGKRLEQAAGVMLELSVRPLYESTPRHWEVLDFLRAEGFEPVGFSTISRTSRGELVEYDGIFSRAPGLQRGRTGDVAISG